MQPGVVISIRGGGEWLLGRQKLQKSIPFTIFIIQLRKVKYRGIVLGLIARSQTTEPMASLHIGGDKSIDMP